MTIKKDSGQLEHLCESSIYPIVVTSADSSTDKDQCKKKKEVTHQCQIRLLLHYCESNTTFGKWEKNRNWRSGAVGLYSHRTPTVATFLCCGKYILAEHVLAGRREEKKKEFKSKHVLAWVSKGALLDKVHVYLHPAHNFDCNGIV